MVNMSIFTLVNKSRFGGYVNIYGLRIGLASLVNMSILSLVNNSALVNMSMFLAYVIHGNPQNIHLQTKIRHHTC